MEGPLLGHTPAMISLANVLSPPLRAPHFFRHLLPGSPLTTTTNNLLPPPITHHHHHHCQFLIAIVGDPGISYLDLLILIPGSRVISI